MHNPNDPVTTLDDLGMWSLLASTALGRLGVSAGGELVELTARTNVVFEIDGYTEHDAWSLVVKGTAARLDRQLDIDRADTLALSPWIPMFKYVYVRVTPTSLSGRRFRRGPEPDRQAF